MKKGRKSGDSGEEDAALWQMVAKTVRPRQTRARKAAAGDSKPAPAPRAAVAGKAPAPPPAPAGRGFDRATQAKLKKGQLSIEARLDLHGMTQDEAYAALTRFLRRAAEGGLRTVLVITGKGRVGGGVLRRMAPLWLEESGMGDIVLGTAPARPKDGGEGAIYVRLRKKRDR